MTEFCTLPDKWATSEAGTGGGRRSVVKSTRRTSGSLGTSSHNGDTVDSDSAAMARMTPRVMTQYRSVSPIQTVNEGFILAEKFDGVVLSVLENSFTARIFPSEAKTGPAEIEFPKTELSDVDLSLLHEGAPFVLNIGYRTIGSRRQRESSFYMRRLIPRSEAELINATQRAKTFSDLVGWK